MKMKNEQIYGFKEDKEERRIVMRKMDQVLRKRKACK